MFRSKTLLLFLLATILTSCVHRPNKTGLFLESSDNLYSLTDGVYAYFPFDINAEDESGHNFDGTANALLNYSPGKFGNAADFSNVGARIDLPWTYPMNFSSYSVSSWIKLNGLTPPSSGLVGGDAVILGSLRVARYKHGIKSVNSGNDALVPVAPGQLYYDLFIPFSTPKNGLEFGKEVSVTSPHAMIPVSEWTHVAVVIEESASNVVMTLYVNGVQIAVTSVEQQFNGRLPGRPSNVSGPSNNMSGNAAAMIGNTLDGTSSKNFTFDGLIDDFFIYDRALSASEVKLLANPNLHQNSQTSFSSCGGYNQPGCERCKEKFWWPPWQWGSCKVRALECHSPFVWEVGSQRCECPEGMSPSGSNHCINRGPDINVVDLPQNMRIDGVQRNIRGLKGIKAEIDSPRDAAFVVPDASTITVDCKRLDNYKKYVCENNLPTCNNVTSINNICVYEDIVCSDIFIVNNNDEILPHALYNLEEWMNQYNARLMVNANFFDVRGPANFPYVSPCTQIFGPSVSGGREVSNPAQYNPVNSTHAEPLDAFAVYEDSSGNRQIDIIKNSNIGDMTKYDQMIGGFITAKDGRVLSTSQMAASIQPSKPGARTAIGLNADRSKMLMVVVQSGRAGTTAQGLNAKELATYMVKNLGMTDVMNLDNSGSSQLIYKEGNVEMKTMPGDFYPGTTPAYRPIPNFLGVR